MYMYVHMCMHVPVCIYIKSFMYLKCEIENKIDSTIMIAVNLCTNGYMYVTANHKRDGRCMDDFIYCITYCTVEKWFLDWKEYL